MLGKTTGKSKGFTQFDSCLFLIFAGIFFIDRMIKMYSYDSCISVFCVRRAINMGAAFGILRGQTALLIFSGIAVLLVTLWLYKRSETMLKVALALIAAGTLGNLFDRILFKYVVDVFSVFGSPSFNLADISNFAGALIILILLVNEGRSSKGKSTKRKSSSSRKKKNK